MHISASSHQENRIRTTTRSLHPHHLIPPPLKLIKETIRSTVCRSVWLELKTVNDNIIFHRFDIFFPGNEVEYRYLSPTWTGIFLFRFRERKKGKDYAFEARERESTAVLTLELIFFSYKVKLAGYHFLPLHIYTHTL